nr:flavodoxin [uncultured Oscillibacter sp.]
MERTKRSYALALALCMALALTAMVSAEETAFSDVDGDAPYAAAVRWAAENGYVTGYGNGRFGADDPVTRAQMAAIFHRSAGSPAVSGTVRFPDVAPTAYYAGAAAWAADSGLVNGYADGRFGADDPVTRQQLITILWRWAGSPEASAEDLPDESAIAAYARTAADWSQANGILALRAGGRFDPRTPATRAEVVSALYQYRRLPGGETPAPAPAPAPGGGGRVLIAYFSNTGSTEAIAKHLEAVLDADLYRIVPEIPYTPADLDYTDPNCRANREQGDALARPAISGALPNLSDYDAVFLGYPIWHGQAPKILYTFLESADFGGRTIVPFCTSGSSGIGSSAAGLRASAPDAVWLEGRRFSGGASRDDVGSWAGGLDLPAASAAEADAVGASPALHITVNGVTLTAALSDNSSARAFRDLLAEGPRTIEMHDYAGMEKVGPLGRSLPANDEPIDTQAGDIILYQGDKIVLYYAPNSWDLTRLGRIDDAGAAELREILGGGDVSVTFSLG